MALTLVVAHLLVVVRMTVSSLRSNRFSSSRGRNHFPALTSMKRKHSANVIIIYHDFLPTSRRGSHVKSGKTHTQSSRYTP